ncbi:MAG: HlyD family type I secretion periplasmic adaptor subunit [Kiloniellales bacterium]|nr:HlyD family type I secretion periplasmic adaptor subunit [Kiloniellales bacterium]
MSKLDRLVAGQRRSGWRPVAWLVMLLLAAGIAWAAVAELDEVAVAPGEIVPRDKVKVIQHLEGGIIERILIEEGSRVARGDPLVELELPVSDLNIEEIQVRLASLVLRLARLSAEAEGGEVVFPEAEAARHPDLAAAELQSFIARREQHRSRRLSLTEQQTQRSLAIKELKATQGAIRTDLAMSRQNLAMSADLLRDRLTSKMEHLEREREVKRLEGELAALRPAVPRAEAALAEITEKLREADLDRLRQVREETRDAELELAQTRELLAEATQQDSRTVIRSPADGVVKNLRFHTIGGVVRPGDALMELVPTDENLVVEVKLSPTDRGYVEVGQEARAKITTYDFVRYGALRGRIVQISPDSTTSPEGEPYYRVVMEPERTYLGEAAGELPIMPGMLATVDIKTGKKSVLSYIVEPVVRIREEAFRERL